jgi:hypothetical protein
VGKPEGKRPLGRPRCRWEDNIKMDFQEVGCKGLDWIMLPQDRDRWWNSSISLIHYSSSSVGYQTKVSSTVSAFSSSNK